MSFDEPHARFRTVPGADDGQTCARIGFVFGQRALARALGEQHVLRATGPGRERFTPRHFTSADGIARFCVRELNGSFRRAGVDARVTVGAVGTLAHAESRPFGPNPAAWFSDLYRGRVASGHGALPLECWAHRAGVNCLLLLVDWNVDRAAVERGACAGVAVASARREGAQVVFHPAAIADIACALTAHTLAHEFGHLLGCAHEAEPEAAVPSARAYVANDGSFCTVMAAGRRDERGRRLEWSRPGRFGDADHDEAAWLRIALAALARERFQCGGGCAGEEALACGAGEGKDFTRRSERDRA